MQLSITELHNLTGLDRRRITRALSDLEHTDGKKGAKLYPSHLALPLLYIAGDGENFDGQKEQARLTHHKANIAALEEKQLSGELVTVAEVEEAVGSDYANVRAKLLSLPSKASPQIVSLDEPESIRVLLEDLVYEALNELTQDQAD